MEQHPTQFQAGLQHLALHQQEASDQPVILVHQHRDSIQHRAGSDQQVLVGQQTTWVQSAQVI